MLKLQKTIYLLFAIFIVQTNMGMDTEIPFSKKIQRKTIIHLSDGTNFPLERWKVFESTWLHKNYLRRQKTLNTKNPIKNMSLFYCDINEEEMKLYSQACDQKPQAFNEYFSSLSPQEQRSLIITAGEYAENNKKRKLNNPILTAQLLEAYLIQHSSPEHARKIIDTHIKSKIDSEELIDHYISSAAPHNLPLWLPDLVSEAIEYKYTETGSIQKIPSRLQGGTYDGPFSYSLTTIDDQKFMALCIKSLDDNYEYHITTSLPYDKQPTSNDFVIRLLERATKKEKKSLLIEHKIDGCQMGFDRLGDYLFIRSDESIRLLKFVRDKDNFSFDSNLTTVISQANKKICQMRFNIATNAFGIIFKDNNNEEDSLLLYELSNDQCVKKFETNFRNITHPLFSKNGDRFAASSFHNFVAGESLIIWNTTDLSHVSEIARIENKPALIVDLVCAPDGKNWAAILINDSVMFIKEQDDKIMTHTISLPQYAISTDRMRQIRAEYSPDSRFLAILSPSKADSYAITLYNAITHQVLYQCLAIVKGIGFTADSSQLVIFDPNDCFCAKVQLLSDEDQKNIQHLRSQLSLPQLTTLLRLLKLHTSDDVTTLYEEESAYKTLQLLPNELKCRLRRLFPKLKIMDNHKELSEICKETYTTIESSITEMKNNIADNIADWWKSL
jgi:hypothetical protein